MRKTMSRIAFVMLPAIGIVAAGLAGGLSDPAPAAEQPAVSAAQPGPESAAEAGGLTRAEFEAVHAEMTRMAQEGVWAIPWKLSLREGRELAVREKKPILLWSSNQSHPLGPV